MRMNGEPRPVGGGGRAAVLGAAGGTPGTRPDRPLLNGVPSPFIKTGAPLLRHGPAEKAQKDGSNLSHPRARRA